MKCRNFELKGKIKDIKINPQDLIMAQTVLHAMFPEKTNNNGRNKN